MRATWNGFFEAARTRGVGWRGLGDPHVFGQGTLARSDRRSLVVREKRSSAKKMRVDDKELETRRVKTRIERVRGYAWQGRGRGRGKDDSGCDRGACF